MSFLDTSQKMASKMSSGRMSCRGRKQPSKKGDKSVAKNLANFSRLDECVTVMLGEKGKNTDSVYLANLSQTRSR